MDNNYYNNYNNQSNPYQQPNYQNMDSQNGNSQGGVEPPKKKKNFGVTLGKCAIIALVFGLVAGTVFTGVNFIGNKVLGVSSGKEEESNRNSEKEDVQLQQQGEIEQTSTGNPEELTDVSQIVQ